MYSIFMYIDKLLMLARRFDMHNRGYVKEHYSDIWQGHKHTFNTQKLHKEIKDAPPM